MKRLDLKVGFQCNNHCLFCIQGDKRYHCPDKNDAEVRKVLKKMSKDHDAVTFTGGEPTIRKELISWVYYARELGYKTIQIQSNGRMFSYKNYCQELIRAGANEFSPALHGSTPKIHDSLTRAPGSWAQTVQGIRNLKSAGQYVLTNSVVNRMNYKDLPNLAHLFVDLDVDQFQFAFMHISSVILNNEELIKKIVPRYKEAVPFMKKAIDVAAKAHVRVMTEAVPYCFMKGYEKYIAEQIIPFTSVVDDSLELDDYREIQRTRLQEMQIL